MEDINQQEIIYFQCDKKLKSDFYRLAQEKNVSPSSLLRAFMRKAIKASDEEKNSDNISEENNEEN